MKKIEKIWNSIKPLSSIDNVVDVNSYPQKVKQYIQHCIKTENKNIHAVRISMNGQIKMNKWYDFTAEQIIVINQEFLWQARVSMGLIPIIGYDQLQVQDAQMKWKLFGIIPIINAKGMDLYKSAIGRYAIELLWIPTFFQKGIKWNIEEDAIKANFNAFNENITLCIKTNNSGKMEEISLNRWGNIDSDKYKYIPFGAYIEEEQTFDGCTIPSRLRAGWFFGSSKFDTEGEFFRVTINNVKYK